MGELDRPGALYEKFLDDPNRYASAKKADETFGSNLTGEYERLKQSRDRLDYLTTERSNRVATLPDISPTKPSITSELMGGNAMTGPDPGRNANQFSNLEYTKQLVSQTQDIADSNRDPYEWAKPYSFNTGINNADFDRYYTHPLYSKLGYSPFLDNEDLYNEKATWADDFNRMRKQWAGLALEGVKSMWGSADSEDFERRNKIAQTSKGGVGGFATNLLLNFSYTAGVATDLIAEELALSYGIAATGGMASEVLIPQMAASAARASKLFGTAKSYSQIKDMLNVMKGAKGREFFEASKAAKTAGNIADYLNPFRYSTRAAYGLSTGAKGYKGLEAMAQVSTGAGAFLRDMVRLRAAYGESKLEGDGLQVRYTNDLIGEYYAENGKMPEGDDADRIYSLAREVNFKTQLYNMPLLLVTNDMVFGKAFRGFSPKWLDRAEATGKIPLDVVKEAGWKKLKTKPFEVLPTGYKKFASRSYWKQSPTKIALGAINYGKANFFEGAQETMQETISNGIENYYTKIYHDPLLAGSQQYWSSMKFGAASQLNGQGFETFLSGFLMGGILQVPQNLIGSAKERYGKNYATNAKYIKEETDKLVASMNDVVERTGTYLSPIEENVINQKNLANGMRDAENSDDRKGYQDAKNASMFGHIRTLLEHDQYDVFMDALNDLNEMTDTELAQAFNTTEKANANNKGIRARLAGVIEEAENIKNIYENFGERFTDPSDPGRYNKKTHPEEWKREIFKRQAYKDVKYHVAFGYYTFKKTQSRMGSILDDTANGPLNDILGMDVTTIFDAGQRSDRLKTLAEQVKTYKDTTPELQAEGKQAKQQLEDLDKLSARIAIFEKLLDIRNDPANYGPQTKEQLAEDVEVADELKKAYFKYVKTLSKNAGTTILDEQIYPSLNGFMDYLHLSKEHKAAAEFVNFLYDPENFITTTIRQGEFIEKIREEAAAIYEKSMTKFNGRITENNIVFNKIFKLGVRMNNDSVDAFDEGRYEDIVFMHINAPGGPVDAIKEKPLYDKLMDIMDEYKAEKVKTTPVSVDSIAQKMVNNEGLTTEEETFKAANTTAIATAVSLIKAKAGKKEEDTSKTAYTNITPLSEMDAELVKRLTEAHAKYNSNAEEDSKMSLEDYVKNQMAADVIIGEYNVETGRVSKSKITIVTLPPIISKDAWEEEVINEVYNFFPKVIADQIAKELWYKKVNSSVDFSHLANSLKKHEGVVIDYHKIPYVELDAAFQKAKAYIKEAKANAEKSKATATNAISNGDKIISVEHKPVTNEITDTEEIFITTDKNPDGRIYVNMAPLKDVLVVPNNTLTVVDKKTGKEIINQELNPEGAVIFEAMEGRLFVIANINGQLVPFYKSSAGTSGKTQGDWYPFFGYTGSWLVKGWVDNAGKMSYSSEIDKVTELLNENLVFPDKYINRVTNQITSAKDGVIADMNKVFKINRLWQKGPKVQTGNNTGYEIKGLKENTRSESGLVALITGLNATELDSSGTPKELKEWLSLINKNIAAGSKKDTKGTNETSIPKVGIVRQLKKEFVGKVVYGTPGIGKTTASAHNPNLVDGDTLLLKYLNLLEAEENVSLTKKTDDLAEALYGVPTEYDAGYDKLDVIYDQAMKEADAVASAGKTVLFGSHRIVSDLPLLSGNRGVAVFSKTNKRMLEKGVKKNSLDKIRNSEDIGRQLAEVYPKFKIYETDTISELIFEEEGEESVEEEESIMDDIAKADLVELDIIEKRVKNTEMGYFLKRGINYQDLLKNIANRRIEVARSVIIAELKVGQEFLMKDLVFYGEKGWGVVTKVTDTEVSIAKKGRPGQTLKYKKTELQDKIWQKISLNMEPIPEQIVVIDETTKKFSDESMKENKEMSAKEKKEIIANAKGIPMEDLKKNMFKKRC